MSKGSSVQWTSLLGSHYLLPVLAVLGLLGAGAYVVHGSTPPPVSQPVAPPAIAPFTSYIAGSGIVETSTRNIAISAPVGGIAVEITAKVGQRVDRGELLFRVDDRDLAAQFAVREAAAAAAHAQVREAKSSLDQALDQLQRAEGLSPSGAISRQELANRRFTVDLNEAKVRTAQANAALSDAQVRETRINIGRLSVRAPIDGDILQVNVQPGEYAQTGVLSSPLILMGDTRTLHVRIDIDENDAWRFRPGVQARAFLRGNSAISFDMQFAYVEPFVVPKRSLTGESTERVDTRVLQVIFSVARGDLPIYVGQQVDVYIETPAGQSASGKSTVPAPPSKSYGALPR